MSNVRFWPWAQAVDATQALNLSAGVSFLVILHKGIKGQAITKRI